MRLKTQCFAAIFACSMALPLWAQDGPVVQGEVTKVDLTSGTITITHGPIPALGMPSERTDEFQVRDAIMLNAIRPGERLTFTAGRMGEKLVITAIVTPKP